MNITIPISRFDSSGGIRVLTVLANGLANRGYRVRFVVPKGQHEPFFRLHERVIVQVLKPNFGNNLLGGLLKKLQLAFGVPSGTDVAIANAFMTAYSVRLSQLFRRTKRGVYFVQHYEPVAFGEYARGAGWLKWLKKTLASATYHLGLECVTNSRWTAQMLVEKHQLDSSVVPLGVDTGVFKPGGDRSAGALVVLGIGNANPIKRFDLFVEVARLLHTRARCEIVVATPTPSSIVAEGLPITFVSPKSDSEMAEVYNRASVFVSTSASEGFGLPLLEAMACGTPVVTTDSGGILDFCEDCVNCRIVKSGTPKDLADAVWDVHLNEKLRDQLVQNGLATAVQWRWERLIDAFEAVLDPRITHRKSEAGR